LVLRDVTEHRQTERRLHADAAALGRSREALQRAYEELATVHRDLEKKSTELDRVNRELVELDRARAQLFSEVTHELQTPLVSIRGYTQMILEGRLGKINDEQRRGLEVALRNVDRMVELIQNLLALAKSEGQQPLRAEPVDLDAVVDAVFQRVEGQARRKNVELVRRITAPVKALAERDGLTLVLENLVSNAIKFNRSAGRVVVSVSSNAAGFVTIEVEDTGVGIPEDERARVFERFYRGRTSTGTTGSGIGLATAKNVVERHGGRIEVLPAPSGGTLMRVSWPQSNILVS
jgi:signal transduction histidine kinase